MSLLSAKDLDTVRRATGLSLRGAAQALAEARGSAEDAIALVDAGGPVFGSLKEAAAIITLEDRVVELERKVARLESKGTQRSGVAK